MPRHSFVDTYKGPVAYGLDRKTDEATIWYYLQKFSDDRLMAHIMPRMTADELSDIFHLITQLLQRHLTEAEYHELFLKHEDIASTE